MSARQYAMVMMLLWLILSRLATGWVTLFSGVVSMLYCLDAAIEMYKERAK